ncbi:MAG: fumarylacetoacetate hydrolase family protein [Armatimonadetes bacterium]|nr:fumarylacetoacetate hydrolase family protein [Armatimonadota bacterium]
MKLVSYHRKDGEERIGIWREDLGGPYDLVRAIMLYSIAIDEMVPPIVDMLDLLQAEMVDVETLREIEEFVNHTGLIEQLSDADYFKLIAPIPRPGAVYALGRNYPAHARESGVDIPEEPIVFAKAPTAVIGPDEDVVYKKWLTRVDPEAELAVVIGKQGSNISEEDAPSYIAGYTCLNDVTARDIQSKDLANSHPWFRSKSIETFCPMGPWIVLTDEISLPLELDVTLRVNGEIRQKDNTRNMTFSVPYLISWISRYHTLYPGDVISTGTPEGMKPVFPGDVMEVEVEKVGVLRNRVVAES